MNAKKMALGMILSWASLSAAAQKSPPKKHFLETKWARQVTPANNHNEYPRPQMERKQWQNLNGQWDYAISDTAFAEPAEVKWQGKILVPYPVESALSGVQQPLYPSHYLWYRRKINAGNRKPGTKTLLHFGAVDWQAKVYVNGEFVGAHEGGYTAFSFDVTPFLKNGDNEILLRVYDPTDFGYGPRGKQTLRPSSIYYTATSGIWQTVWMETITDNAITDITLTPDIDKGMISVTASSAIALPVQFIVSAKGKVVKTVAGNTNTKAQISIPGIQYWSPENPFLYDLAIHVMDNKKVIDEVKSYFGMRKVAIQKDADGFDRIFLNNKPYYNLGVLDQGFWPDGLYTAPNDEALAYDIKAIKSMGFNTIRKHIKVEPQRWYYHADKIGVLVWQDMVNLPFNVTEKSKAQFEKESAEILDQLNAHPSITTWVLFNERWGSYDQQRLTEWIKSSDPTRIVNGHSGELLYVDEALRDTAENPYVSSDMTDVHSYPNPRLPLRQAGKAMVLGEFGGVGVPVPYHQYTDVQGWGYVQVKPAELEGKYEVMTERLQKMQQQGLSGSIYTQPFDVEGEENGLITYDREIIKIPEDRLREINGMLFKSNPAAFPLKSVAKKMDVNDNDDRYGALISEFEKGRKDSAFLRRLTLMAMRKQDQPGLTRFTKEFVKAMKNPFQYNNQVFLYTVTRTSSDTGFAIYRAQPAKVNEVIGRYAAERKLMSVIAKEEIEPYTEVPNATIDWDKIENAVKSKYGEWGQEVYYGRRTGYHWEKQQWKEFGKYYKLYFDRAIGRSGMHVNNMSWPIFEHITDTAILNTAIKAMKYDLEHYTGNDPAAIDTYANLLYKSGREQEAIEWEQKAVTLSNNGKEYIETLNKMKRGEPTWPEGKKEEAKL